MQGCEFSGYSHTAEVGCNKFYLGDQPCLNSVYRGEVTEHWGGLKQRFEPFKKGVAFQGFFFGRCQHPGHGIGI